MRDTRPNKPGAEIAHAAASTGATVSFTTDNMHSTCTALRHYIFL